MVPESRTVAGLDQQNTRPLTARAVTEKSSVSSPGAKPASRLHSGIDRRINDQRADDRHIDHGRQVDSRNRDRVVGEANNTNVPGIMTRRTERPVRAIVTRQRQRKIEARDRKVEMCSCQLDFSVTPRRFVCRSLVIVSLMVRIIRHMVMMTVIMMVMSGIRCAVVSPVRVVSVTARMCMTNSRRQH